MHLNEALMKEYQLKISTYEQQIKSLETQTKMQKIEFQNEKDKLSSELRVSNI